MIKKVFLILKSILSVLIIAISVYLLYIIQKLAIIPDKYYFLLLGFLTILNIITIIGLFSKNKIFKIISIILFILIGTIDIIGIKYGKDTDEFLTNAFDNFQTETRVFHIVVKSSSDIKSLSDLNNLDISYYTFYNEDENIKKAINEQVSNANILPHDDLYDGFINFLTGHLTALVIDDGYLEVLSEAYDNLDTRLRILYTFEIESKKEEEETPTPSNPEESTPSASRTQINKGNSFNVYLSGSDSRSQNIANKTRSDVNMILTINPDTKTILLTSIPRDYYVQIHNQTGLKDKLTHSGIYGLDRSKETVADLFNIDMDYAVKVGFSAVVEVVDLVGGVDINSDKTFNSYHIKGWVVEKGINHMDGAHALAYARERYAYASGDRHRILNQQQVLEATLKKIMADKSILLKYDELLTSLSKLYITDIPREKIADMIKMQLNNMASWTFLTQSVDGTGSMQHTHVTPKSNLYVMIPNQSTVNSAKEQIIKVMEAR